MGLARPPPATYASSPGVTRSFCATCGSPLTFASTRWPGETHSLATSLSDPTDYHPTAHVFCAESVPWAELREDSLKRLPRTGSDPV